MIAGGREKVPRLLPAVYRGGIDAGPCREKGKRMRPPAIVAPAEIERAAADLKRQWPAYAALLDFYARLYAEQETAGGRIQLPPLAVPAAELADRGRLGLPLLSLPDFGIDPERAAALFGTICRITASSQSRLADAARGLADALDQGRFAPEHLFNGLLGADEGVFDSAAATLGVEKSLLAFLTYHSMKPSICARSRQLAVYLEAGRRLNGGVCPVCGSAPGFALLDEAGARTLVCGFCWHSWDFSRIRCPACGNGDSQQLSYFFNPQDPGCRVDLCDRCRHYLKTFDVRKTGRSRYWPLALVASLHLDLQATEAGYRSALPLGFELASA